ncbi:hypothetical protein HRED_09597 [Candidatus Haloredivivus sp. G17]|nr:hypothetical protein HRED_09597 [Candidatus Haloredivivus sp. G17]
MPFRSILSKVGKIAVVQVITQQLMAFSVAYFLGFGLLNSFYISMCTIFWLRKMNLFGLIFRRVYTSHILKPGNYWREISRIL